MASRSFRGRAALVVVTLSSGALGGACLETQEAPGKRIAIGVAPLSLTGVSVACYDLRVLNDLEETVWTRGTSATSPTDTTTVCSSTFGNASGGDISYVGPCDATEADAADGKVALNRVDLWVDGLYGPGGADLGDYRNPCPWPAGCSLSFECKENEDVQVSFDLVIMRDARQGFFDIGVNFEDVFCSAKADTCYSGDPGAPIELLAHSGRSGATDADGDGRFLTGNSALACTAGPGAASTVLRMSPVAIVCANGVTCDLDPAGPTGNNTATCTGGAQVAYGVYRGTEQLACGEGVGSCQKMYWNLAVNLEDLAAAGFSDCEIRYDATATTATTPTFSATTPGVLVGPSVTYPAIHFAGPLLTGTAPSCGAHALNADEVVTTTYLQGCDESVGAPACTLPVLCNTLVNEAGEAVATACSGAPENHPPVVVNAPIAQSTTVDQYLEFTLPGDAFIDPDGDALTLSASVGGGGLPAWLTFDPGTGTFTGTPTADDMGQLVVTVIATDPSGASAGASFTIDIAQGNQAPVVSTSELSLVIAEGQTETVDLASYVTDPDGDILFINTYFGAGFASNADLVMTFSPMEGDGPNTYTVYVQVSDGIEYVDLYIYVQVTIPNRAPTCNYGSVFGTKQTPFTYNLNQAFTDPDGDALTFSLGPDYGPFPTGSTIAGSTLNVEPRFSDGTAQVSFPDQVRIGDYWYVNVIATDPSGLATASGSCLVWVVAYY